MKSNLISSLSAFIIGIGLSTTTFAESEQFAPGEHTYFNFSPKEDGNDPGVALAGGGSIFYCQNAQLGGYDFFTTLHADFPALLVDSAADAPSHIVVDMAYAVKGTMAFNNVVVANSGLHTISFRYAFGGGLFPALHDRPMGLKINGKVVVDPLHFPRTASFNSFKFVNVDAELKAGKNVIEIFCISDHGVARFDTMTVMPVPAAPKSNG